MGQPTTSASDPARRTAFCPSCGATLLLDEEQLVYKRARCAACGDEIELVHELFGRRPRVTALIPVGAATGGAALATPDPPPSRSVAPRGDEGVVLRPVLRWPEISPVIGFGVLFAMGLFVLCLSFALGSPLAAVAATIAIAAALVWPWRVRITVEEDALVVARGPFGLRRERVPLAAVHELSASTIGENHLVITLVNDYPMEAGAGLHLDEDDVEWAERRLGRAIRLARIRARQDGPER